MFQEKRPTCVSVIGWVWIVLGALMAFSAAMALLSWNMIGTHAKADPEFQQNMPSIIKYFPYLAAVQLLVAVTGFVSGINFLKLKSWSRMALEILTWLLLLFVVGFGGYTVSQFFSESSSNSTFGFGTIEIIFMIAIFGMYLIPLTIMVRYLKGKKVKTAMIGSAEQRLSADA